MKVGRQVRIWELLTAEEELRWQWDMAPVRILSRGEKKSAIEEAGVRIINSL